MPSLSTKELTDTYVLPTYGRFDLCVERGERCRVWDESGREYIDFGAGIAVCSLGHAHPAVTKAVAEQSAKLVHTSNLYYTRPAGLLAEKLVAAVGHGGKVFFCNSGAEANEGLYKLARSFGHATGERYEIITLQNSFHGRTLAGIAATGQEKVRLGFGPVTPGFRYATLNDIESVRSAITDKTAAILVEPVQGEGGIRIGFHKFLQETAELCREHDLLLLFDEVQCGLGRTGDWCGWKSIVGSSVTPDAVSWAKGIANGFPLGAFWVGERKMPDGSKLCDRLGPGSHGTTYGGNPVACAAALAVMETIEQENLLEHVTELGAYLREELRALDHPLIEEVRAIGLMVGIQLVDDYNEKTGQADSPKTPSILLVSKLLEAGLIGIPAQSHVLRFLPPFNTRKDEIDQAVAILREVLG